MTRPLEESETDPRSVFSRADVVASYEEGPGLSASEILLFRKYIRQDSSVLDLGVGAGRTSEYLSQNSGRYIGVDLSPEMIAACRRRFPHLDLRTMDASDLSAFAPESFDAVVFSFNGLDYLQPAAKRSRCVIECRRLLKPGGVLILSSHNPRCLTFSVSLSVIRAKTQSAAERLAGAPVLLRSMAASIIFWPAVAWVASLQCLAALRKLCTRAFWTGEGLFVDSAHGGLLTYAAVPQKLRESFAQAELRQLDVMGAAYPLERGPLRTPWYYYAFTRVD